MSLILAILAISGCSSTNYISTQPYSKKVADHCINNLPEQLKDDKDSKSECAVRAFSSINFAYKMYEFREQKDLQECQDANSTSEAVNTCFAEKQDAYYQNIVSQIIKKSS